ATPETRLEPELLWASRTLGERISAAIAALVVLPFVAESRAVPSGSREASSPTAPGSTFARSFPGRVVPPPRPARRERPPAARASAISSTSRTRSSLGLVPRKGDLREHYPVRGRIGDRAPPTLTSAASPKAAWTSGRKDDQSHEHSRQRTLGQERRRRLAW